LAFSCQRRHFCPSGHQKRVVEFKVSPALFSDEYCPLTNKKQHPYIRTRKVEDSDRVFIHYFRKENLMKKTSLSRLPLLTATFFFAGLLVWALPAPEIFAQEDLPSGSYTKSCSNCFVDHGGDLRCKSCKTKGKGTRDSSLKCFRLCQGDIWNDDGWLKCNYRGSFWKTCWNVSCTSGHLKASCNMKKKGSLYNANFDYNACSGDISNCNGSLTCGSCP